MSGGMGGGMSVSISAIDPRATAGLSLPLSHSLSLPPKKELVMALERVVADCQQGTAQFVSGEREKG